MWKTGQVLLSPNPNPHADVPFAEQHWSWEVSELAGKRPASVPARAMAESMGRGRVPPPDPDARSRVVQPPTRAAAQRAPALLTGVQGHEDQAADHDRFPPPREAAPLYAVDRARPPGRHPARTTGPLSVRSVAGAPPLTP